MSSNNKAFLRKPKNDSGIILLSVLGVVLILSVLAIGLGRTVSMDTALTQHAVGQLRAYYLARAGIVYGIKLMKEDLEDDKSQLFDSLTQCGIKLKAGDTAEKIMEKVPQGSGYFSIFYESQEKPSAKPDLFWGFQDEERKINLNAIQGDPSVGLSNYMVLSQLLQLYDVEPKLADSISAAVADWHDAGDEVTDQTQGAEKNDYQALSPSYICKNRTFDQIEELLLVKGMTPEIFSKIKDFITVFPKENQNQGLRINLDTAPEPVLRALARGISKIVPDATSADADKVVESIVRFRVGHDQVSGTIDDQLLAVDGLNLERDYGLNSTGERNIFDTLIGQYRIERSQFFRIRVMGVDERTETRGTLEAVVNRENDRIVYWRRI